MSDLTGDAHFAGHDPFTPEQYASFVTGSTRGMAMAAPETWCLGERSREALGALVEEVDRRRQGGIISERQVEAMHIPDWQAAVAECCEAGALVRVPDGRAYRVPLWHTYRSAAVLVWQQLAAPHDGEAHAAWEALSGAAPWQSVAMVNDLLSRTEGTR